MRKRVGSRELAAAGLIITAAVLYWMKPAAPPVTVAVGEGAASPLESDR